MNLLHKPKKNFLNLYFQVHQPRLLGQFSFFDIGTGRDYFDDGLNQIIIRRVAKDCYLPANFLLLKLIQKYPNIRITFSISGSALKQLEVFAPAVVESFQMLAATGAVEFLSETYYHSLSFLHSKDEFTSQIEKHTEKVKQLFGMRPTVFRNTELIYNDDIGRISHNLGFKGVITEGVEKVLGERSPNYVYQHPDRPTKVFLRNYRLSDDIAFRYTQKEWSQWPLTPTKYVSWLEAVVKKEELITLSMDYETFGEHHKANTGIFLFLENTLTQVVKHKYIKMVAPSEAIELLHPVDTIEVPEDISWADENRDLSAWLGNDIQQDAFDTLGKLEESVKITGSTTLLNTWRYLQTSDHFYYMSTKAGNDRRVHDYFSPYASPYEAFMNYMNVLSDLSLQIEKHKDISKIVRREFTLPETSKRTNSRWRPEKLTF